MFLKKKANLLNLHYLCFILFILFFHWEMPIRLYFFVNLRLEKIRHYSLIKSLKYG